jgi:hypothetical protein
MVKVALFMAALLTPVLALGASPTANLSVNVISATGGNQGNCPTSPPTPAVNAGYTTLAYCLDGANPANATLSNWLDCTGTGNGFTGSGAGGGHVWMWAGYPGCDTTHWNQTTDPVTGKTVLHYQVTSADEGNTYLELATSVNGNTTLFDVPHTHYMEIRWRTTPSIAPWGSNGYCSGSGNGSTVCYGPDFYFWGSDCNTPGVGCGAGDGVHAPIEDDVIEMYQGNYSIGDAFHDWEYGIGGGGNGYQFGITQLQQYAAEGGSYSVANPHSYGTLVTQDLTTGPTGGWVSQLCKYIDGTLMAVQDSSSFTYNCGQQNFSSSQLGNPHHLVSRLYPNLWMNTIISGAGYSQFDTYIEYIAAWTCANWKQGMGTGESNSSDNQGAIENGPASYYQDVCANGITQ